MQLLQLIQFSSLREDLWLTSAAESTVTRQHTSVMAGLHVTELTLIGDRQLLFVTLISEYDSVKMRSSAATLIFM